MPSYPYPRPSLTVDVVLFRRGEQGEEVLLIRRAHPPFAGRWALPGGFVDEMEPLEKAARRELREETGITLPSGVLRQVGAFGEPGRDPRGWTVSVAFWAAVPRTTAPRAGDDAAEARWWPCAALPPLAFDHRQIIARACELWRRARGVQEETNNDEQPTFAA